MNYSDVHRCQIGQKLVTMPSCVLLIDMLMCQDKKSALVDFQCTIIVRIVRMCWWCSVYTFGAFAEMLRVQKNGTFTGSHPGVTKLQKSCLTKPQNALMLPLEFTVLTTSKPLEFTVLTTTSLRAQQRKEVP